MAYGVVVARLSATPALLLALLRRIRMVDGRDMRTGGSKSEQAAGGALCRAPSSL
jgi:hypothetical protein